MQALEVFQKRLEQAQLYYQKELARLEDRWALYSGTHRIDTPTSGVRAAAVRNASLVRNMTFELIETQISSQTPQPRVTPCHPTEHTERNARAVEAMIEGEMRRLKFQYLNDEDERLTYVLGGAYYLIEWDGEHGRMAVRLLHPRQVLPEPGVYDPDEMQYIFVRFADSAMQLRQKYGCALEGLDDEDEVEHTACYFRNAKGGIGLIRFSGEEILEEYEDYQRRQIRVCAACAAQLGAGEEECACGHTKSVLKAVTEESVPYQMILGDGTVLTTRDERGQETLLPGCAPDVMPLVVRKNVSIPFSVLGDSDCDKIRDLQMAYNKLASKVEEKLLKGGSVLTVGWGTRIETTDEELKVVRVRDAGEKALLGVLNLEVSIAQDLAVLDGYYEQARSTLGVTDSYQGKKDPTATSGVAKRIAVQQAAGRLESKRVMKDAAYAQLFRRMFLFMLCYCDAPKAYVTASARGTREEVRFNRYEFLVKQPDGSFKWDLEYLFDTDSSASMARDRAAMWAQVQESYAGGAFGDPKELATRLLLWRQLERLNYPNAGFVIAQMEKEDVHALQNMQDNHAGSAPDGARLPI